jgi:TRAP transporter TAXI family solute receptor
MVDGRRMADLRAVMSLHAEPFTVLVRREIGAFGVRDLRGRRVDLGHSSSGRRVVAEHVLRRFGLGRGDFAEVFELQAGAGLAELCAGRIDATLLIIGHPNEAVGRALADCDVTLLPVGDMAPAADDAALYEDMTIPAGAYPGLAAPIPTFGVFATVVARADTPDAVVETLVRETLANLPRLARRAPVLAGLDPALMRTRGLSAPLHPAAERAFAAFAARP